MSNWFGSNLFGSNLFRSNWFNPTPIVLPPSVPSVPTVLTNYGGSFVFSTKELEYLNSFSGLDDEEILLIVHHLLN